MAGFGTKRAIGLMSGTSADGIDAALLTTDGEKRVETGAWRTTPYQPGILNFENTTMTATIRRR